LIVTRAVAFNAQPAFSTAPERTMPNRMLFAAVAVPGIASMQPKDLLRFNVNRVLIAQAVRVWE
jgi:hypothetical protein